MCEISGRRVEQFDFLIRQRGITRDHFYAAARRNIGFDFQEGLGVHGAAEFAPYLKAVIGTGVVTRGDIDGARGLEGEHRVRYDRCWRAPIYNIGFDPLAASTRADAMAKFSDWKR